MSLHTPYYALIKTACAHNDVSGNMLKRQHMCGRIASQWRPSSDSLTAKAFAIFGLRTKEGLGDGVAMAGMGLEIIMQAVNEAVLALGGGQSLQSHHSFATTSGGLGQGWQDG
jgi:hypothetical protein